ncbi:hypothetical protein MEQU1_000350 [Malassezia equina]|uniref:protein-tyrosine-phosphatase n=1 Tax=Malassezia equina TaxID=1381935 RepID=A0AAF0EBW6_9BASI|nr:hypothetical protein MEQU1_000350 [Malassezia equina]
MEKLSTLAPNGTLGIAPELLIERLLAQAPLPHDEEAPSARTVPSSLPLSSASFSAPSSPRAKSSTVAATAPLDLGRHSAPATELAPDDSVSPSAAAASPMQPRSPVLEAFPFNATSSAPLLLLDTRPTHIFRGCERSGRVDQGATGHLAGAINLQVPTLLLRRTQRALSTSPELLDTMDIAAYIHSDAGVRRLRHLQNMQDTPENGALGLSKHAFRQLLCAYWFLDVVVLYEDDASAFAALMLLRLLVAQRERAAVSANDEALARRGGLYFVQGGMLAVRQHPASQSLLSLGDTPADSSDTDEDLEPLHLPPSPLSPSRPSTNRPASLPRLHTGPARSLASSMERRHSSTDVLHRLPLTASLRVSTGETPCVPEEVATARESGPWVFDVSTIIPGRLYVGPDVQKEADVQELQQLDVRAVLNTAVESDDRGAPYQALRAQLQAYKHLPMRDVVEAVDVQASLKEACAFIDKALTAGYPTYVHCRAGKSRSTTCVMAYLIQARSWTLQQAYAYVAAQRQRTSPNIGFIAELMQFERDTLGTHTASVPLSHHSSHDVTTPRVAPSPTCPSPVP